MADRRLRPKTIVVVGLGRFGLALAQQLQDLGEEVLGLDTDAELVQAASGLLTYVVQADATDQAVLHQLGVDAVQQAVVAIGDDMQSSILATANLADVGIEEVWAKAVTEQHARILERVGATRVVFPERDMGYRVAHRVAGNVLEYFQVDDNFVMVETRVPDRYAGRTLAEAGIRPEFTITVVGIQTPGGGFGEAAATTVLEAGCVLLVAGTTEEVARFSRAQG